MPCYCARIPWSVGSAELKIERRSVGKVGCEDGSNYRCPVWGSFPTRKKKRHKNRDKIRDIVANHDVAKY